MDWLNITFFFFQLCEYLGFMFGLEYDEISGLPSKQLRKVNRNSIVLPSVKCEPEKGFFMQSYDWKWATSIHYFLTQMNFLMCFIWAVHSTLPIKLEHTIINSIGSPWSLKRPLSEAWCYIVDISFWCFNL